MHTVVEVHSRFYEFVCCFGVVDGHQCVRYSLVSSTPLRVLDPLHLGDGVGGNVIGLFYVP